ncbi:IS607 family transposase [Lacticaseibacillus paracasei]|uniref:IS607 family transposase n=1 Tax=Lacticaseibacillus paracasei TaxID=1597 RepID=UPI0007BF1F76|nr:IS607 family transposase [Lacticaseibacillus paracasei]URW91888.1 IS607 family transposase [Lacticaseibacillus paracasei]
MAIMKPKEMADRLGITVRTLQEWDRKGKLPAHRTPTDRRYYTEDQYQAYINDKPTAKKVVAYARVSTSGQKDDLKNQLEFIQTYANAKGIILDETITDIGSGLNYKRKKWNQLLDEVQRNEVGMIFITYKDRFIRFGYDWFEHLCAVHGAEIIVLNNKETSPDQELVEDLVSIVHVFSCRLYGLRKYKQILKKDPGLLGGDSNDSHAKS